MLEKLYLNTHHPRAAELARAWRLGLEMDEFLFYNRLLERSDVELARKLSVAREMAQGIERRMVHGTIVGTQPEEISAASPQYVRALYETSYSVARRLGASGVVFHSDMISGGAEDACWIERATEFWSAFLQDKDYAIVVYVENLLDSDPLPLAKLYDALADRRLQLCLDIGHANANSIVPVSEWIKVWGSRIGHTHLHNNDGTRDQHCALGEGTLDMQATLGLLAPYAPSYTIEADYEQSLRWLVQHGFINAPR